MSQAPRGHGWTFVLDEPRRILLADDDPILTEFAKVHLATPVAAVESAADGQIAWQRLCTEPFDLAMIDIQMPVLDGFDLVAKIRSDVRLRHLPIVMLTGRDDIASIDRAYQVGANAFAAKPVNWRQLSYQLRYVLRTSRMEAELRAARNRAEESSVLKSNILSVMRHQFRTPLNSIIGFSDIVRKHEDGTIPVATHREYAEYINTAAHRLNDALMDMVSYVQLSSGEFELADDEYQLSKIVDMAIDATAEKAALAGIEIKVQKPDERLHLVCDRDRLVRTLNHLLENAIVHGRKGPVEFCAERGPAGELIFSVTDPGCGIPSEQIAASMQPPNPPRMLTRSHYGLGLGLPIARHVAELHDGTFEIKTLQGSGTTVRISLPPSRLIPWIAGARPDGAPATTSRRDDDCLD